MGPRPLGSLYSAARSQPFAFRGDTKILEQIHRRAVRRVASFGRNIDSPPPRTTNDADEVLAPILGPYIV